MEFGGEWWDMEAQCMEVGQREELSGVKEPEVIGWEEEGSKGRGSSSQTVGVTSCDSAKWLKVGVGWLCMVRLGGSAAWLSAG